MAKPKKSKDARAIEKLTGYKTGRATWDQVELFGIQKVYGGEGAPTHDEYLFQLADPRWTRYVKKIKDEKVVCEKCGAGCRLEVHHPHYVNGRLLWEYKSEEVMLLCRTCHEEEHRQILHRARMAANKRKKELKSQEEEK